jgi:uncharacterized membrane protein
MGQQLNKITKRKRRLARVKRKKEVIRDLKANPALAKKASEAKKAAAPAKKKVAAKKPASKKVEAPAAEAPETTAEA